MRSLTSGRCERHWLWPILRRWHAPCRARKPASPHLTNCERREFRTSPPACRSVRPRQYPVGSVSPDRRQLSRTHSTDSAEPTAVIASRHSKVWPRWPRAAPIFAPSDAERLATYLLLQEERCRACQRVVPLLPSLRRWPHLRLALADRLVTGQQLQPDQREQLQETVFPSSRRTGFRQRRAGRS